MPRIVAPDGTELFYRDWGAGSPVVFVHGMLLSSAMWQHQMAHLAGHGFRAVACDRRGHGRSDDPGRGYDFDTLADDLAILRPTSSCRYRARLYTAGTSSAGPQRASGWISGC